MKKKIKKFLLSFILTISIFTCLCFTTSKSKADTNIPDRNSYMLNLQDIYLTMREAGLDINDFVGTTCLAAGNQIEFFKVGTTWFNRIYVQITNDYSLSIYYLNSKTYQRADVVSNNNVIDYYSLNINIPDTSLLATLYYYLEASQGIGDLYPREFFNVLFANVESSYAIKNAIYRFNFPDLFDILYDIGWDTRTSELTNYATINWSYRYIIYSTNDIILTFDDNTSISCNIILIGNWVDDNLTFYFLKSDFTDYTSLYYFNADNTQVYEKDYYTSDEINNIYFPYDSSIYSLSGNTMYVNTSYNHDFKASFVFDISFIYGYVKDVVSWDDFFISIINVPVMYLRSLTNFNIFGFNLFYTLTGILSTLFILWLIRKF